MRFILLAVALGMLGNGFRHQPLPLTVEGLTKLIPDTCVEQ